MRSGARASMPGMMDTVLNLGLNDATVGAWRKTLRRRAFAFDSYRRFHPDVFDVVLGVDHHNFEDAPGVPSDGQGFISTPTRPPMTGEADRANYKKIVERESASPFPQDPREQLGRDRRGVLVLDEPARDHLSPPARHSRPGAPPSTCRPWCSATWATRPRPASPSRAIRRPARRNYGEFLINAQGEDVVAGIRTPQDITGSARIGPKPDKASMEGRCRTCSPLLCGVTQLLETHYRDMQDIEFTVERGKLWMLQTPQRQAHRQGGAADRRRHGERKPASDLAGGGARVDPASLDQLAASHHRPRPSASASADRRPARLAGRRLAARSCSPTTPPSAKAAGQGHPGRVETSPEDIHGMHAPKGILTTRGGMTSHAAVVGARHGQALRLRRRRHPRRLRRAPVAVGDAHAAGATSSPSTARPARCWGGADDRAGTVRRFRRR